MKNLIKNKFEKTVLLVLAFSFFSMNLSASGWPQKKGEGYLKLSEWWIVANQHYTDAGVIDPNVTTGIFNTTFYGEVGLTNRLTAIINAPLYSRALVNNQISDTTGETIQSGDAINSVGDIDVALKIGLTKSDAPVAVSSTLLFGIPSGISAGGQQDNLQTGDGEFNQMIRIDVGKSIYHAEPLAIYANIYVGYNNRTNQFSDEFRYGAEVGVGLLKQRLWLTAKWNGLSSLKNGALASSINSTSIFANNSEYQSIALGTSIYATKKFGFSAEYATAVSGKIILAAPSYSVGVFYDF